MRITLNIPRVVASVVVALCFTACGTFTDDSDSYGYTESVKDLSGIWMLQSVTRNDVDITDEMDFSQFALHMNSDGSYHIENYLPFIVEKDGHWTTDDPQHPFILSFTEDAASDAVQVEFNYPVSNGERTLSITLSPGCSSNSYTYTMKRSVKEN